MSPRARKASDEEVFAAAARAMSRRGPAQLTLGEIAADVGLTPAALVQRFGSKRKLLLALAEKTAAASEAMFAELRRPIARRSRRFANMPGAWREWETRRGHWRTTWPISKST